MKLLLHNTQTGLFYAGPKDWTEDPEQAVDLKRPDIALDVVSQAQLQAVELVMRFEESSIDFPVTIVSAGK
jgi:hypothetical protein